MKSITNNTLSKFYIYFLYTTPIFFILGNPFINLFVLVVCLSFYYVRINYKLLDKSLIYLLTIISIIFLISSINSVFFEYSLTKSISYLRFFLLLILLPLLLKKIDINLKNLGIVFFSIICFVIFDSLIQLFFGKDIFGIPDDKIYNRLSGPFGDELIVGNFVFYFGFLSLSLMLKNTNISNYSLFFFFITIGVFSFITGERNTFLSYFIFMFFLFLLSKKKLLIFFSCFTVFLISTCLFLNFERFNIKYNLNNVQSLVSSEINKEEKKDLTTSKIFLIKVKEKIFNSFWFSHYRGGIKIFEKNKLYGSGFKTFRYECPKEFFNEELRERAKIICTTHPHNIYIELLSDTGILGFITFLVICLKYLFQSIKRNWIENNLSISIINCLLIVYIFPFRPHGSLFSTSTSFIFWFIFSFLIFNLYNKKSLITSK